MVPVSNQKSLPLDVPASDEPLIPSLYRRIVTPRHAMPHLLDCAIPGADTAIEEMRNRETWKETATQKMRRRRSGCDAGRVAEFEGTTLLAARIPTSRTSETAQLPRPVALPE